MAKTKTVQIKGWIVYDNFWARHGDDTGAFVDGFSFSTHQSGDKDRVTVCEHTLTLEVPVEFDPRPGMVANLEEQKRKAQADFTALVTNINRQISELQAIEYTPEEA